MRTLQHTATRCNTLPVRVYSDLGAYNHSVYSDLGVWLSVLSSYRCFIKETIFYERDL